MAYKHPLHQSLNGQLGSPMLNNGVEMNGRMNSASMDPQMNGGPGPFGGLRAVDPEQLKARLYSYAPQQAPVNPRVLRFNRITQAQVRKQNIPVAPKLEPVVSTGLILSYLYLTCLQEFFLIKLAKI